MASYNDEDIRSAEDDIDDSLQDLERAKDNLDRARDIYDRIANNNESGNDNNGTDNNSQQETENTENPDDSSDQQTEGDQNQSDKTPESSQHNEGFENTPEGRNLIDGNSETKPENNGTGTNADVDNVPEPSLTDSPKSANTGTEPAATNGSADAVSGAATGGSEAGAGAAETAEAAGTAETAGAATEGAAASGAAAEGAAAGGAASGGAAAAGGAASGVPGIAIIGIAVLALVLITWIGTFIYILSTGPTGLLLQVVRTQVTQFEYELESDFKSLGTEIKHAAHSVVNFVTFWREDFVYDDENYNIGEYYEKAGVEQNDWAKLGEALYPMYKDFRATLLDYQNKKAPLFDQIRDESGIKDENINVCVEWMHPGLNNVLDIISLYEVLAYDDELEVVRQLRAEGKDASEIDIDMNALVDEVSNNRLRLVFDGMMTISDIDFEYSTKEVPRNLYVDDLTDEEIAAYEELRIKNREEAQTQKGNSLYMVTAEGETVEIPLASFETPTLEGGAINGGAISFEVDMSKARSRELIPSWEVMGQTIDIEQCVNVHVYVGNLSGEDYIRANVWTKDDKGNYTNFVDLYNAPEPSSDSPFVDVALYKPSDEYLAMIFGDSTYTDMALHGMISETDIYSDFDAVGVLNELNLEYIMQIGEIAVDEYRDIQILPSFIIAQAIYEGGWPSDTTKMDTLRSSSFNPCHQKYSPVVSSIASPIYAYDGVRLYKYCAYSDFETGITCTYKWYSLIESFSGIIGKKDLDEILDIIGGNNDNGERYYSNETTAEYNRAIKNLIAKYDLTYWDKLANGENVGDYSVTRPQYISMNDVYWLDRDSFEGKLIYGAAGYIGSRYSQDLRYQNTYYQEWPGSLRYFDCSSFTYAVYGLQGYHFEHDTSDTIAYELLNPRSDSPVTGQVVGWGYYEERMLPGDLIFWKRDYNNGRHYYIYHVGIYAGNGYVLECRSPGVVIDTMWGANHVCCVIRINHN